MVIPMSDAPQSPGAGRWCGFRLPPSPSPMAPPMTMVLGYDPKGKMEPRDIVSSKDGWSEYILDDGSTIRAKGAILEVKRAVGQFNSDGDPIYVMQLTIVTQLRAPDELKKGYVPPSVDKVEGG